MRRGILWMLVVLGLGGMARAENTPATRVSLKGLAGMAVRVHPVAADAQRDGLSAQAIESAVVTRLRQRGIPVRGPAEPSADARRASLEIVVATSRLDTDEYLYSIHVGLTQWAASLERPDLQVSAAVPLPARTWAAPNVFGITPNDQLARQAGATVAALVDQFIEAFHLANPSEAASRVDAPAPR